ncbi:MAG: hypothetical protein QHH10_11670 [Peptococcaceae bacterium]|jgi:hypothetical protein|nr:hypothetical protein [Peptococcaceae bacterium]MDH7525960.1 hypothetical protein [Peptococcaceae bacterium]
MPRPTLKPLEPRVSQYGIAPHELKKRACELPGMTSLLVKELFPEIPDPIYTGTELEVIREEVRKSLQNIDFSRIKPGDSVNILTSHHGFTIAGGRPFAEMLKTIKDEVQARTGATDIRLRAGVGVRFRESEEYIKHFELDKYFNGKAECIAPVDRPIKIETIMGPLYGIAKAYDAKWIIHAHNDDVREVHLHRMIDRILKPFGMSYARIETRSTYHSNMGSRAANFIARAIYESPFVQEKFAGSVIMKVCPTGIIGFDSDIDLIKQSDRITVEILELFGKWIRCLNRIKECIVVIDCPCPIPYTFGAGLIFANFMQANVDIFDLSLPVTPYGPVSEQTYDEQGRQTVPWIPTINPAIKMMINNYSYKGFPSNFYSEQIPTIVVGQAMAKLFEHCESSNQYMKNAVIAWDLDHAMKYAKKVTKTENVLVFDGAQGGVNVSESLREFMLENSADVSEEVTTLMPKWLKQRGIEI